MEEGRKSDSNKEMNSRVSINTCMETESALKSISNQNRQEKETIINGASCNNNNPSTARTRWSNEEQSKETEKKKLGFHGATQLGCTEKDSNGGKEMGIDEGNCFKGKNQVSSSSNYKETSERWQKFMRVIHQLPWMEASHGLMFLDVLL
ncbi:hypothetical protein FRX31_031105 [Thalictrum thalictroides]|uniref:Uncharacterized protein n=1 Tax=Thalictrum thalictroides TaxID=46969 RepID=A0A7J6V3Q7_THATH|nr:hypothetical protein FRX31_031105 [Thalictrum thalictroides]